MPADNQNVWIFREIVYQPGLGEHVARLHAMPNRTAGEAREVLKAHARGKVEYNPVAVIKTPDIYRA